MCALYLHCVALLKDTLQQVSSLSTNPKGPKIHPMDATNNNLNSNLSSNPNQIAIERLQKVRNIHSLIFFFVICQTPSLLFFLYSHFFFLYVTAIYQSMLVITEFPPSVSTCSTQHIWRALAITQASPDFFNFCSAFPLVFIKSRTSLFLVPTAYCRSPIKEKSQLISL